MKTRDLMNSMLWIVSIVCLVSLASCNNDDDDPIFGKPTIALSGGSESLIAKPGESFQVGLTLDAEGGNSALIVNRSGGFLERITLESNATSFTYQGTAPATATEGEDIPYEFILVNRQNLESDPLGVSLNMAVYNTTTIGSTSVYEVAIPTDGIVASGTTVKFSQGRSYFIGSSLQFEEGSSLEIEAGVTVYMNTTGTATVQLNFIDAEVEVIGTAASPVVMTSDKALRGDTPAPGDWNRFRLQGVQNSTLRYVRIEYADEGLRVAATNTATNTIEYIQSFKSSGEGFYFTNGNVNAKYLLATDCESTSFRLGDAYAGKLQFLISVDSETFSEGEEVDIRETASPILSNVTAIGPGATSANTHGVRLRASSSGKIFNSIVAEFPRRGVRLNDNVETTDINGPTVFAHSYVFNVPTDPFRDDRAVPNNTNPFRGSLVDGELVNPFFNNITGFEGSTPLLATIAGIGVNDFVPAAETVSAFNPTSADAFFSAAPYVGAIRDNAAANDWTLGWSKNADGTIRN